MNIQKSIIIGSLIIGIAVLAPAFYERYEHSHKIEKLANSKITVAEYDIELLQGKILYFKKDYGRYPESLEELVPDYVKSVAIDPWGQKYEYKREGDNYVLYSSGLLIYK